jgi:fucose permease
VRAVLRTADQRRLLAAGMLGFFALGALQSLYGPAFPSLVRRFEVGLDAAGWTVAAHFAGSFVTIAAAGPLLARLGYRLPLATGAVGMAAGALVVAAAPGWSWVLAGAALGGLGFGLVDVALNLLVARSFAPNAAPALNLLNAFFGVGSVVGPLAVAAAFGDLRAPMVGLVAVMAALFVLVVRLPEPRRPGEASGRIPWLAAGGFLLFYFLYVASEVGVGSWVTVHLAPLLGERTAAVNASLYWGAMTVGRLLAAPLSARVRPATLVLGASALALAALGAAHLPALAPYAYPLVGLAFAPIFPTGLAWLQRVFPRRAELVASAVLAAATLGPVATSGPIGWIVERAGPASVPSQLVVLTGAMAIVVLALWRSTRRA